MVSLIWVDRMTGGTGACEGSPMPRRQAEEIVWHLLGCGAYEAGFDYFIAELIP
jgi:hypothetical protein